MAVSRPALLREQVKTITQGTTGFTSARTKLGVDDIGASTEFLKDIVSDGAYAIVRPVVMTSNAGVNNGAATYEIQLDIYWGFAADADYDITAIEDVLHTATTGLIPKLLTAATWQSASLPAPNDISQLGPPEINSRHKPHYGRYSFNLSWISC